MKAYSIYIFDLDGTLTDTTTVWLDIYRDILLQMGVTPPDYRTLAQHTHAWREMLKLGLPEAKLDDFIALAIKTANERLPEAAMHTGAWEMLERLQKAGKRIAVFSTLDRPIFEPAMRNQKLDQFAEVSVAGTDVPERKPSPLGLLKALDDLRVPKTEYNTAVYVGDKDTDALTAANAGIDSILFFPPEHQAIYERAKLAASNPTFIITSWKELTAVL